MGELIHNLGIDWKLLIANAITFFIVLWVLRKFAYGPIMRALDQRQATIAQGLSDAKQRSDELEHFQEEKGKLMAEAKRSAQAILRDAETEASAIRQRELDKTQADATQLLEKTKAQLERERSNMVQAAKAELADLVVAATESVLHETVDASLQKKLEAQAVKAVKNA